MRCLRPSVRRYVDLCGKEQFYECPCGRCLSCLVNEQDSWSIRINETCKAHKEFVYTTLTFNDSSLPRVEWFPDSVHNFEQLSDDVKSLLLRYSSFDSDTGELRIMAPALDRSIIRNWIKRARELYMYYKGERPKWKFLFFVEYGPKTSRPHLHGLFWGISQSDFQYYLEEPWNRDYGFTKTHFIKGGTQKDRRCISRYVSKYVSKGVFESPLVKAGFSPKPFRCISRGVGEEYLRNSFFDVFRSRSAQLLKSYFSDLSRDDPFREAQRRFLRRLLLDGMAASFFERPSNDELDRLAIYFDDGGYPHKLPRYYKQKLLQLHKPNLYAATVQALLLARARLHRLKGIAEFARKMGHFAASVHKCPWLGMSKSSFDLVSDKYLAFEQSQAEISAKGRYIELSNHYKRAMNLALVA